MSVCPACHRPPQQATRQCPHCGHPLALNLLAGPTAASAAAAEPMAVQLPAARCRGVSRRKVLGLAGLTVAGAGLVGLEVPALVHWLTSPPTLAVYSGDDNFVRFVAWFPDGKRLAFGGFAGVVHLWDTTTGQHLRDYPSPEQGARLALDGGIAWSPDETRLASMHLDGNVQVWDVSTGQVLATYGEPATGLFAFAWSPDWARIALAQFDAIQVVDGSTRSLLATYRGHTDSACRAIAPESVLMGFISASVVSRNIVTYKEKLHMVGCTINWLMTCAISV